MNKKGSNVWYETKPIIHGFFACIAGDPLLAAKISAILSSEGYYFPVLDAPRMKRPDASNEVIRRVNVLALLHSKKIIFAGLRLEEKLGLLSSIPLNKIINIQNEDDLLSFERLFSNDVEFKGNIHCRRDDIALGLLLAKYGRKRLIIDDNAGPINERELDKYTEKNHLVMLDDRHEIAPIVAANYAFMLKAKIKMLPPLLEQESESVYEDIMDSGIVRNSPRGEKSSRSLVSEQLKLESRVEFNKIEAKFITFFTKGYPYGYFFSNWPTTHIFSYPDVGLSVVRGLMQAKFPTNIGLTIDPGFFQNSETKVVNKKLVNMGAFVKCLKGKDAKVYDVGLHLDVFPYDFLFICSHAGTADGEEITLEFLDRQGNKHEIVIEEAVGFGITDTGTGMDRQVEVKSHYGLIAIDGKDWQDKTKKTPKGLIEDFYNMDRSKWKIIKRKNIPRVRRAVIIKMNDGNYIPMLHGIGGHESPLIFNNACVTFNEFSERFMFAGARAYIGTLTEVSSPYAKNFAEVFFNNLDYDKPIPLHLWETQMKLASNPQEHVYMHVGVFHTFMTRGSNSKSLLKERINNYIKQYEEKNKERPTFKDKMQRYIEFLKRERIKI